MTFASLTAPQLDIDAGAVSDTSSNPIVATTDQPIIQGDMALPLVESAVYDTNLGMFANHV